MSFLARKIISASSATEEAVDDDFNLVTGLYHFDGSNGAQNNTYVDTSSTSKTLTKSGNTTQGTFSPFSADEGKWSAHFSGSEYFEFNNSDFAFGTGDFTIELWIYFQWSPSYGLFSGGTPNNQVIGPALSPASSGQGWQIYHGTSETNLSNTGLGDLQNTWVHVAYVRASNVVNVYQNGVKITSDISDSTNYSNNEFSIGYYYSKSYKYNGRMSNFRVVKGTAVYTGAFTPPTEPLTAITNTKLLTFCSNRYRDKSTSSHTLTPSGTPDIQPFSPFAPSSSYSAATKGGSANFPNGESGNKIECGTSADFAFGTGAFTVEGWAYVTADAYDYSRLFAIGPYYNDNNSVGLTVNHTVNSDKTSFYVYAAGGAICLSTSATPKFQWFHWAVTRDGTGDFRLFTNGNLDATNTSYRTTNISPGGNQPLTIGSTTDRAVSEPYEGFISNVRVVKGTAIYTSSFTVPTAPVADVTNTKLLANFTNAAMFDQSGKTNAETVGNAQLDTSVKKFGTASAEFDNNGDYLTLRHFVPLEGHDFTIECFVNFLTVGSSGIFQLSNGYLNSTTRGPGAGCSSSTGKWGIYYGTTWYEPSSSSVPSTNTWYHVAFVKNSNTSKLYIDGTEMVSATDNTNYTDTYFVIGGWYSTSYLMHGYIDDFRISLKARYTSNFTAPTKEFPNL